MKKTNVLVRSIQKSRKYSSIFEDLIRQEIDNYFKKNPKDKKYLDNIKSKNYKKIIKTIRSRLHQVSGSFNKDKGKREQYLKQIYGINDYKNHDEILKTNVSTKERLNSYGKLYKKIFSITGKPKKIIDIGSGINPVSYPYMGINGITYYAYDVDKDDCELLNKYFKIMYDYTKLKGKAFVANLSNISSIKKLPRGDICFMFKFLDVIEGRGHKLSEEIIKEINCKNIVVSFPTKTVSGKKMKHAYRGWIEKMLERIKIDYEKVLLGNEVFYVIKK